MHIRTLVLAGFVGTVGIAHGLDFSEFLPADIKCVSIVAPASHADNAVIEACSNELAKTGRKVKVSPGVWTYTADAAQRARYLEEAWQDPETDFILCARGGSGSWDTLRELDFSILKERDIPFMGFSNISVLMNGFVAKGVKRPISGPLCTTLVNYPNTAESLRRACATINRADLANTALTVYRAPEAAVTGKPLGGHFPSLSAMSADWLPDSTGRVIFLEVNSSYTFIEALAKFDTLKATGWFANAGAVVLCDMGIDGTDVEKEQLRQYITDAVTCPVFSGYPYGHVSKLFAIDYDRAATIAPDGTLSWESYATTLVIDAPAGTATNVTTAIMGGNVSVSVNPTGAGTVRLGPDNTYLGSTTLGGGALEAEKLAPKGEASSLGCEGDLFINGGTLRYVGTAAATFDRAITCSAVATVENVGDLTLKGAVTSPKKVTKAGAGTLTLTSTGNNIDGSLTVDSGTLRITGGKTLANNIYVGDNTAVAGKEFWAGFEMTGGTVTLDSGTSFFVANKNKAHVTCDISGGTLTVPKNFGVGFEDDGTVKEADIVIRDKAKVVVTKGTGQRTYFYTKTKGSRTSFTIRDGATFSTSYFCRYSNSALNPTVLFDGANIVWPYDARECFGGNGNYYTLAGKIYVGPKGVAFAGGSPSYVRNFAIPLVASNTLSAAEASGVTFKTGTYEMNAAMAWKGPTAVALDATLAVGAAGSLPPSTELVLDGALAVVAGSPVAVGGARGYGTVTVYADATRETPVTAVGTYPVLTAPAAARAELEKFAATAKCGNWSTETFGYFTVTADGGTATLSLVVAGYSSEQPTCGVEGTNATSRVLFGCSFDALEKRASDGALCVKPGTTATLRAFDTEGGTFVGCWRDDTTGDILFGEAVQVTPTALTTYTAVFGKPWTFDGSNLSDGEWKFAATAKNGEISVDKPSAAPDHGVLNLATPACDASGTRMRIVAAGTNSTANTMFGAGSNTYRKKLKTLYLGADLTTVGYGAFRNCSNLTGRVSVPPGARKLSS